MRTALFLAFSLATTGCALKVDGYGPVGASMAASYSGESAAGDIQGSLLSRTRAIEELNFHALDGVQDPMLGVHVIQGPQLDQQLMLLDRTFNGPFRGPFDNTIPWSDPGMTPTMPGGGPMNPGSAF